MSKEAQAALIWCPCPDHGTARRLAEQLLEEKLIACANIVPAITSVFEWEGKTQCESETGLLLKTTAASLGKATAHLGEHHPYDTPAIMGWLVDETPPPTLEWLLGTVR